MLRQGRSLISKTILQLQIHSDAIAPESKLDFATNYSVLQSELH
ncbi:hypothetical protein [Fischerella thermalis]|nr:hypothetical protein [Fischerella thermalis]